MLLLKPLPTALEAGMTRRRWLEVAFAGSLVMPASSAAGSTPRTSGKAKSCIIIYLFGGPSHLDIWDLKPDAPAGIRGEFKPIRTNVPGIELTEHLPRISRLADKLTIIRSMTHGDNAATARPRTPCSRDAGPRRLAKWGQPPDDFPNIGSIVGKVRPPKGALPPYVSLPWTISTSTNVVPGQGGGFLGAGWDPFRVAAPRQPTILAWPISRSIRALPPRGWRRGEHYSSGRRLKA